MKSYTLSQIERWRERVHRRSPRRHITSKRQAVRFVNEVGFCFVFRTGNSDLPCLGDTLENAEDGSILPDERDAFHGKLLLRRPMLISLEYLPYFIALIDGREAAARARSGKSMLGTTGHMILEHLRRKSPQSTRDLQQRITMSTGVGKGAVDLALTELQTRMLIASLSGRRKPSSAVWAPARKLYRGQAQKARRIIVEEARRAILERHFRNQLVVTVADIRRLFRWERQEIFQTLGELISRGIVTPEVQVEGIAARTYCLLT
jgi:hypothetical protein